MGTYDRTLLPITWPWTKDIAIDNCTYNRHPEKSIGISWPVES